MILIIAILAVLLLIACVAVYAMHEKLEACCAQRDRFHTDASVRLTKIRALEKESEKLRHEIGSLHASFKNMLAENEEELGFGHHVKWRSHRKPTSETYRIHFDMEPNGQRILEELTMRFKRGIYTDDERETCRRIGRSEVVDFIINRINTANDSKYSEHLELAHMEQYND